MMRGYSRVLWIATVCLAWSLPLEGQKTLSEKAQLQIRGLSYDGPDVNQFDYNSAYLYVRATIVYEGDQTIINDGSKIIAGCWMNTELASSQDPGKDWSDWGASCFNNDYIYSPDFPHRCGEHLINKNLKETLSLSCQNGAPAMPRCFQSTKPNRFIGWASGGAMHLNDGLFFNDVGTRRALPPGEIPCHRHFLLHGIVEGLEPGESLQFHADVPDPVTGVDKPWDRSFTATSESSLSNAPQIAEGATYKANITF
jgi:hypothetical protein